ncbi:hypothetical protein ACUN0C_19435 [Faunimonas sp. B44]|uniref:hypothetical protein n=1 Tax=Faunimonas sp. B44 TaxID=3461493 RepID=UPI0040446E37
MEFRNPANGAELILVGNPHHAPPVRPPVEGPMQLRDLAFPDSGSIFGSRSQQSSIDSDARIVLCPSEPLNDPRHFVDTESFRHPIQSGKGSARLRHRTLVGASSPGHCGPNGTTPFGFAAMTPLPSSPTMRPET